MYYAPQTTEFGVTLTKNDVLTARDQDTLDDKVLRAWTVTDGFGRTKQSFSKDPQGNVEMATIYDALSRVKQVSNPFRPSLGESAIYTTTVYDFAGRVTSVTTPDSAVVGTSYAANTVTVTDQAGKQRKSVTDGLGRLVQVYEAPNSLNYLTNYSYDTLDDLTGVSQYDPATNYTQTRSFSYDSLKRLTSAWNPESNTVSYQYDPNGNLAQKADARGVVSTYGYDALNRNTSISYSDGSPGVGRVYDTATNGKGRLAYQWATATDTSKNALMVVDVYDAAGRATNWRQLFWQTGNWNAVYSMSSNYDLAGHIKSMTYPSGRSVSYSYDGAGRTNSFTGTLGDGTNRNYSTGISYSSLGGMSQEQFGTTTPIYNKLFYNSRGQLAEIREGTYNATDNTWWNRGAIINFYDTCWGMCGGQNSTTPMPNNNGNLKHQLIYIPNDEHISTYTMRDQAYDYDSLNRLHGVHEHKDGDNPANDWQQQYAYDRYGNRTLDQADTYGTGIPNPYFGVDPSTNRLTPAGGYTMGYDAAGNLTNDNYTGGGTRVYDAENRMTQADGGTDVYTYDADGRRVKRKVGATETWQVYGIGGELIAEYAANGNPATPQKEYGYRNGQLLITATITNGGGGTPFTFTDDPLVVGTTPVRAVHVNELRTAVNQARAHAGLPPATWTDDPAQTNVTAIMATHIAELRTKLGEARSALGLPPPSYTDPTLTPGTTTIKAAHISELRTKTNEALTAGGVASVDVRWLVNDQLGTPRMIFEQSGSLAATSRHNYLPFGEELLAGTGGRTTAQGYPSGPGADGVRQQFTQKERDNETGLDYFGARYYANTQGRFTSVDPYNIAREVQITATRDSEKAKAQLDAYLSFPEQWNRYGYTANNPLKYVDPTGELLELTGSEEEQKAAFERIKWMVGKEGAKYLVMKQQCTNSGHCGTYVGYNEDLSGRRGLAGTSELNAKIGQIIDSDKTVEFRIADSFTTKYETRETGGDKCGGACTVGAEESLTGNTQIFVNSQDSAIAETQLAKPGLYLRYKPPGVHVWFEDDVVEAHEFGHAYANAIEGKALYKSDATNSRAWEFENLQRSDARYKDRSPVRRVIE